MNCFECKFARKFPGDCKYVVCYRFGGFRRVDGKCPKALVTNGDMLKALNDLRLFVYCAFCPPGTKKSCEAYSCADCWEKWFESPADMEFWRNFEGGKANDED